MLLNFFWNKHIDVLYNRVKEASMLLFLLIATVITPPGMSDAIEAFSQGRLNLVYVGELPPVGYRDQETGLLLESIGCEMNEESSTYASDWNDYMLKQWAYLGSDSTSFVIRYEEESLVYQNNELVYIDSNGSVPIPILPEDLAGILAVLHYSLRDSFEEIVHIEFRSAQVDEVIATELPYHTDCIERLFVEGRLAIRRN